ncbi:MAG: MBL fold metallo-hydrolase [Ignavibacteria bacterium]|nr:MBL fold metallo-hydrolase [Ignavibacteria bacterium]
MGLSLSAVTISCNIFYSSVRNIPVFFSSPEKVENKISDPVRKNVRLSALWIGHSTVLIQMDDKVIITDPLLTETAGELARRIIEPGMDIDNIPVCDIILISHSHFDHLSLGSLEILETKSSGKALIFPEDAENYIPQYNFKMIRMKNDRGYRKNITGETKTVDGVKVTSVFAQHWGGRYGIDGYIWGDNAFTGYIIEYNGLCVYFAGDTGYHENKFKQLGEKFKIDLALIPIGPCADCNQCGTYNHVFPPCAYNIFRDINAKYMIPIHYGTLMLADAHPIEPLGEFQKIIEKENAQDIIFPLKIGEQKIIYELE